MSEEAVCASCSAGARSKSCPPPVVGNYCLSCAEEALERYDSLVLKLDEAGKNFAALREQSESLTAERDRYLGAADTWRAGFQEEHIRHKETQRRLEACKETGQRVDDQLIEAQRRLGDCVEALIECHRQVPTTWLDGLLTGPTAIKVNNEHNGVEKLLNAVRDRLTKILTPVLAANGMRWDREVGDWHEDSPTLVERHVPNSPNIEPDDFSCCPAHRAGAPSSAPCDFVEK